MTVISIVLPAHNEASSIRGAVCELDRELSRAFSAVEMIVIDDGSTDRTLEKLAGLNLSSQLILVRRDTCEGKGSALRQGLSLARGEVVAYTDADTPILPASIIGAITEVSSGACEVCIGNRRDASSRRLGRMQPVRVLAGWAYTTYVRLIFAQLPHDPACCLKVFSRKVAALVAEDATLDDYVFDIEALLIAWRLGTEIKEIAVAWIDKRSRLPLRRLLTAGFQVMRSISFLKRTYAVAKISYVL